MNASLMSDLHQDAADAPWAWTLAANEARTLQAETLSRWLHVESGKVWLTRANGSEQADDIWLSAGESLALPAGSAWVVQASPQAQLSVLQAPGGGRLTSGAAAGAAAGASVGGLSGAWRLAASLRPALQRALSF